MNGHFDAARWSTFVEAAAKGMTYEAAGNRAGLSANTISNWIKGESQSRPDPNKVVQFAKAFGLVTLEALAAAGVIGPEDLGEVSVRPDISRITTTELATELQKRLVEGSEAPKVQGRTKTKARPVKTTKRAPVHPDTFGPNTPAP
ncbi:helix-turn-helix domain-containing protein [Mycobacteroides abscessus]|uniref:helix-turn-helix domain-containing protein n=1 Tax=Mycobacteroides abscessus TaxID=36809 RepID=UPI00189672B1